MPGEHATLTRAVDHLIRNAVRFSVGGGVVRVRIEAAADGVRVEVADEGVGIPAQELPHVFERFFRGRFAHEQAVPGLGLSIAWRAVLAHGGRLTLTSPGEDKGACAEIWLPAA